MMHHAGGERRHIFILHNKSALLLISDLENLLHRAKMIKSMRTLRALMPRILFNSKYGNFHPMAYRINRFSEDKILQFVMAVSSHHQQISPEF